jgi:hypothetical protein
MKKKIKKYLKKKQDKKTENETEVERERRIEWGEGGRQADLSSVTLKQRGRQKRGWQVGGWHT